MVRGNPSIRACQGQVVGGYCNMALRALLFCYLLAKPDDTASQGTCPKAGDSDILSNSRERRRIYSRRNNFVAKS